MPPSATSSSYNALVRAVASQLLTEGGHSLHHLHHASSTDARELVHHFLVIRPPPDDSVDSQEEERLYGQMDAILELEKNRQSLVDADKMAPVTTSSAPEFDGLKRIALWKGDITTLKATAIVNAANSAMLGCFQPSHKCIDNVIHCKAGPRLRAACNDIMVRQADDEPVGNAKITPGFALPATYVLHTVGPQLRHGAVPTAAERAQLQSCYSRSLDLLLRTVERKGEERVTIAFPCISTGLFAFPSDVAVPLAVDTVLSWLAEHQEQTRDWKVIFNTFLKRDYDLYKAFIESKCASEVVLPSAPVPVSVENALQAVKEADYLLVSAGAGLSAAAGLDYTSEAVMKKFHPGILEVLPGFRALYNSIGFRGWDAPLRWGYMFDEVRKIRYDFARYRTAPTYSFVKAIVDSFESQTPGSTFIKTSNADGMFEQEGFDVASIFVMQGDYAVIQCSKPCSQESFWDVKRFMEKALESFNPKTYRIEDPTGIPKCPKCGGEMSLLLREDDTFLQSAVDPMRVVYEKWIAEVMARVANEGKKLVVLEVGAGFNTPIVLRKRLAHTNGVQLVRVNPEYPEIPFQSRGVEVGEEMRTRCWDTSLHVYGVTRPIC